MERIKNFFISLGLCDGEYFNEVMKHIKVLNGTYDEVGEFVGCYDTLIILPKLCGPIEELVYVHELCHVILKCDNELLPNIYEAHYVNKYLLEYRDLIFNHLEEEISNSIDEEHTICKQIKKELIIK